MSSNSTFQRERKSVMPKYAETPKIKIIIERFSSFGLFDCRRAQVYYSFHAVVRFFPWDVNFVVVWANTEFTSDWEKKIHLNEGFWFLALARILIKS